MASAIPTIIGRKVPMAAAAAFAVGGGTDELFNNRFGWAKCDASCESPRSPQDFDNDTTSSLAAANNPFMTNNLGSVVLRKRMTSIGRFSLKSESVSNPSIPTFFLALSGSKKPDSDSPEKTAAVGTSHSSTRNIFTVNDFEGAWMKRDMPARHPRFHSTVSRHDDRFFEETHHVKAASTISDNDGNDKELNLQIKAELDRHASETMHFSVYREDLRNRIENMLTSPIQVADKLWEVKISSGPIGSSGAISKVKSEAISTRQQLSNEKNALKRQPTKGRPWKDAVQDTKPMESVFLFRSHHALADGASIMAALSDLCDEAQDIRENIEAELKKWKRGKQGKKGVLRRLISRFMRLIRFLLWITLGSAKSALYQGWLQLTTRTNPFDAVKQDAEKKGLAMSGRAISWCDACPLDEAKRITQILSKARGCNITVNDLFVSCISAAVTRQLIEHEEFMAPVDAHSRKCVTPSINVCIPVHLRGGVILPNESLGNRIGAFVARVPGEMAHDARGGGTPSCPSDRLLKVHQSLKRSKQSPAPFLSHYLAKFCSDYLPEQWTKNIFQRANCNACVAISNNRGYKDKIHLNGMQVESAHGFLPLPPGIPIGVVVQSYAGVMSLSVTAEKWAVPDPDKFLRWVLDEYSALLETAAKLERSQY